MFQLDLQQVRTRR